MAGSFLLGVNLAGAEFGSNVPGTFGTDYTYPTHAEIDYYAAKGMSVIRLPFLWERSSTPRTDHSIAWSSAGSTTS
jgi:aryl-phospho-beta-D-glucosidase BglC (GH1 family)